MRKNNSFYFVYRIFKFSKLKLKSLNNERINTFSFSFCNNVYSGNINLDTYNCKEAYILLDIRIHIVYLNICNYGFRSIFVVLLSLVCLSIVSYESVMKRKWHRMLASDFISFYSFISKSFKQGGDHTKLWL